MKLITTAFLAFLPAIVQAQNCDNWLLPDFWLSVGAVEVAHCVAQGHRAEESDDMEATPFHMAAASGNLGAISGLLLSDPEGLAGRDIQGYTPLHYAAESNADVAMIRGLAGLGADIGAISDQGVSVLDLAAAHGTLGVVGALIDLGADPAPQFAPSSHQRETPVMFAARYNPDPRVLALLVDHGASLLDTDMRQHTLLHIAVMSENQPEVITALVSMGNDVNAPQFDGLTPLHLALYENADIAMVSALLAAGGDPNRVDNFGNSPLARGAIRGVSLAIIDLLVGAGADVNALDEWAQTPLHGAASNAGNLPVIAALVAQGADINALDYDLFSPLHFAAATGDAEMVTGMIALGANPGALSRGKRYPLSFAQVEGGLRGTRALALLQAAAMPDPRAPAVCAGWVTREFWRGVRIETIRVCLPFVDILARGPDRQTPVMMAIMAGVDIAIIRALISAGAELNDTDIAGSTVLHFAASGHDTGLAQLVISRGADLDAQDEFGQTPLHRATETDAQSAMAVLLLAAGANPEIMDRAARMAGEIAIEFDPESTGN